MVRSTAPASARPPVTSQVAGELAAAGLSLTDRHLDDELVRFAQGRTAHANPATSRPTTPTEAA